MTKSLFSEYVDEFFNIDIIETEYGFITFDICNESCYIQDLYVKKDMRKQNLASELADKVVEKAKSKGCTILVGSIVANAKHADTNIRVLQAYGFKFTHTDNNTLFFRKDI